MIMERKDAKEILLTHACCTYANRDNLLCNVCPWYGKTECQGTAFTEEMIMSAIARLSGFDTMKRRKLNEIIIAESFANTEPNPNKVEACREYYRKNGVQEKPIVVNRTGVLIDGYIQYLVLKENNEETGIVIQRKYIPKNKKEREYFEPAYRTERTTYIYGIHPNSVSKKERVWRVAKSWGNWADNIKVGDLILCDTKNGNRQVKVTKIETLDEYPVNKVVKKVARRNFIRDGILVNTIKESE